MRKFFVTLMASLLSCSAAFAFWPEGAESSLEIGVGYRHDDYKFKTEASTTDFLDIFGFGSGFGVELEDEFKIKDIKIWEILAKWKYVTCDNLYFRGRIDYGWICRAKHTDEFSAVINGGTCDTTFTTGTGTFQDNIPLFDVCRKVKKGHVYDAVLALGYQFKMCDDSFAISPVIGYSWHGQHYRVGKRDRDCTCTETTTDCTTFDTTTLFTDTTFVTTSTTPDFTTCTTDFSTTCSDHHKGRKFHARWYGPFIGVDFDYRFACDWSLYAAYEYHWARYRAGASDDFRRPYFREGFHHRARRAYGHVFDLGIKWDFCDCWTVGISGHWQWFRAKSGKDNIRLLDESFGSVDEVCLLQIPLKDVTWRSATISLDLGVMF